MRYSALDMDTTPRLFKAGRHESTLVHMGEILGQPIVLLLRHYLPNNARQTPLFDLTQSPRHPGTTHDNTLP
jgi:hypothetical protein